MNRHHGKATELSRPLLTLVALWLAPRARRLHRVRKNQLGESSRPARSIIMLDTAPVTKLRVDASDVSRRAALERRKLREMIEFCYTEYCYRAHILNYFGDAHHSRKCGTCGNCNPHSPARIPLTREEMLAEPATVSRNRKGGKQPTASSSTTLTEISFRPLTPEENVQVRKILACAARMKGRFGKTILAGTLRGSAAKNVIEAKAERTVDLRPVERLEAGRSGALD
jgi:superfamily II DNA helicase RecQ